ncbi:hypothetical protein [Cellulomonas palmilytica]|uniref:hypothetical protein n=1 Tax=Cellulomonas palmilytica TaxID=2608402 RepID=UPI001F3CE814|nr:hypothetical protein [Cellulomonas palmilytica]UJP39942.1 hypothetical protein F1D97_16980 [Cellulomonas palmilytica]
MNHVERDPLDAMLTDLAHAAGTAHGPLEAGTASRVATRVRRRRVARRAGTTVAAASAVGAVAFGATHAPGLGADRVGPASGGTFATLSLDEIPAAWRDAYGCGDDLGDDATPPPNTEYTDEELTEDEIAAIGRGGETVTLDVTFLAAAVLTKDDVVVGYLDLPTPEVPIVAGTTQLDLTVTAVAPCEGADLAGELGARLLSVVTPRGEGEPTYGIADPTLVTIP